MVKGQNKNELQKGATMVEYALLIALIAVIAIAAIKTLGSKVSQQFSAVASQV
ncbi:MAG: Flp family type IVb pilin [Elusimicrobia bacterium CG11_big_fil_rev_8_21_14_0_20_64_6]|nr:MAG: Flp family type IVb pilin [Elusimicrobia bacterium CG11_big_fil_rev_8_21_14_0_20_64_6]